MSQSVKLLIDEDTLRWPRQCARCGAGEPLRSGEAQIAAGRAARSYQGGVSAGDDVLSVDYPVCARHARLLAPAQWLTGNGPARRALRGLGYLLGGAGLVLLGLQLAHVLPTPPAVLTVGAIACALLPLAIVWAFRATPVRLTRLESDAVTIRFGSEPYARAFLEANPRTRAKTRR